MPKPEFRKKKASKRVLALPDLEHAKTAVLNSLTSASGQRTYEHVIREFVAWYCSEPRLAFNRTRCIDATSRSSAYSESVLNRLISSRSSTSVDS